MGSILHRWSLLWTFAASFFFGSCGGNLSYDYKIALDPSWLSLELPGRETEITAFTLELIGAIAKTEKMSIGIHQRSWNNLIYGLQEGDYDAVCSTMQPYLFYEKLYAFSNLYLMTGPVLVVPSQGPALTWDQLEGKVVGIQQGSKTALILEKYPRIIQRTYTSLQEAFSDLSKQAIDAAVADILTASAFTQDLFSNELKIGTEPLTQEGVRLAALKNQADDLILRFNRGLKRLQKDGTYSALAKKWRLSETAIK